MTDTESGERAQAQPQPQPGSTASRFHATPQVPPPSAPPRRRRIDTWAVVVVAIVAVAVAYISLSDGLTYLHIGHSGCFISHAGWHFHMSCTLAPPPPPGLS